MTSCCLHGTQLFAKTHVNYLACLAVFGDFERVKMSSDTDTSNSYDPMESGEESDFHSQPC